MSIWDAQRGIEDDFWTLDEWEHGVHHTLGLPETNRCLLSDYASAPFLMLLGRPGSGKSHELRSAEPEGWLGKPTVLIEAKEIGATDPGIYLPTILSSSSDACCSILIDGLDEILLQNRNFVVQLKAWFRRQLDAECRPRHTLAISCRWADWPQLQIDELSSLWPPGEHRHLVLCPLRRSDVEDTLKRKFGADHAAEFWHQVHDLRLRHVACWPQGLLGLMNQFEESGFAKLASSHAEVIGHQVVRHCRLADSPEDPVRWEKSVTGAEWRQRVAGRVAALMIWSGKSRIDLTVGSSNQTSEALLPNDLLGGQELWENGWRTVGLADLNELIHLSDLLKPLAQPNQWVFQSQVHQEWLAADWLAAQKLDEKRLQQMFGIEVRGRWMVFPVLMATAAWFARFDPTFRELILKNDPLVLLRMDGASLPQHEREEIVEALLKATDQIRVVDSGVRQAHLPSLKHSKLLKQLTHWLLDENITDPAKELAIEIAEKTDLKEIAGTLWELYPKTSSRLQIEVAGALHRLAAQGFNEKWRAVLRNEMPLDRHGRLLGAALEIMVVKLGEMPLRDVLNWIIPRYHFDAIGTYERVAGDLHDHLTVDDIPAVFKKLTEHPTMIHNSLSRAKDFNDKAVRLAIENFHQPEIREALVDYWHTSILHHAHPHHDYNVRLEPDQLGLQNDEKRREIISALIAHPGFERHSERKWISTDDFLLLDHDFEWCLDQIILSKPEEQWRFSLVIDSFVWRADLTGHLGEKLNLVWQNSSALREVLPNPNPDETIVSAISRIAAENQSKRDKQKHGWERKQAKRDQKLAEDLKQYSEQCQEAHARGEIAWPGVEQILGVRASGSGTRMVSFAPISQIQPEETWMIEAAMRYLTDCPLKQELTHEQGIYGLLALAACPLELDREGAVRQSIEKHWLPVLLEQIMSHSMGDPPAGISNSRFASLFPSAFAKAFEELFRRRYQSKGSFGELDFFKDCWLPQMTSSLEAILTEEPLQAEGFFNGLRRLAVLNEDMAIAVALRQLEALTLETAIDAKASVLGAATVLVNGRLYAEVKTHLADKNLVARTIAAVAHRFDWHEELIDFTTWPDQALKDLADACWSAFVKLDRPSHRSFGFNEVTPEDDAIRFRDRITGVAQARGIDVAIPINHADDTADESRERQRTADWYGHATSQARASNAWSPMSASTFFQLASSPNARLARNPDELLAAVMECLRRWEAALKAGAWDHLWDVKTKSSRPEKRIAREMRDWLHAHLDIMVEREVELASEDRTDVLVQTLPADASSMKLTVVIELKKLRAGNAKERRTAMKTQLLDRYLRERSHEGWTHGLYVVAWTPEPESTGDSSDAIKDAVRSLEKQAVELTTDQFKLAAMVVDARFVR